MCKNQVTLSLTTPPFPVSNARDSEMEERGRRRRRRRKKRGSERKGETEDHWKKIFTRSSISPFPKDVD